LPPKGSGFSKESETPKGSLRRGDNTPKGTLKTKTIRSDSDPTFVVRVSHFSAMINYVKVKHQILSIFCPPEESLVTRKERIFLAVSVLFMSFFVQCIVQLFFVQCNTSNNSADFCRSSCTSSLGVNECSSNSLVSGYFLFNSSLPQYTDCYGLLEEPEFVFRDACIRACIQNPTQEEIQNSVLQPFSQQFSVLQDNRTLCSDAPESVQNQILCRSSDLNCSDWLLFLIKVCVGLGFSWPLSFLMRLSIKFAHYLNYSPYWHTIRKFMICCCLCCCSKASYLLSYIFIIIILLPIGAGAGYSLYECITDGISWEDIVLQWIASYCIKKFAELFIWMALYFICCCRHRKRLEKGNKGKVQMDLVDEII